MQNEPTQQNEQPHLQTKPNTTHLILHIIDWIIFGTIATVFIYGLIKGWYHNTEVIMPSCQNITKYINITIPTT